MASPAGSEDEYIPGPAEAAYTTGRLNWTADGRLCRHVNTDPSHWVDDLSWHRGRFGESAFKWTHEDALAIATRFTRGTGEFTTIGDLHRLRRYHYELTQYYLSCQHALGATLIEIRDALKLPDDHAAADLLVMHPVHAAQSVYLYNRARRLGEPLGNTDTEQIRTMVSKMLFRSPLMLAWELKQLWDLHVAAERIVEDTIIDLAVELEGTVPDQELVAALDTYTVVALHRRIQDQREERGEPGDPRRTVHQVYTPPEI